MIYSLLGGCVCGGGSSSIDQLCANEHLTQWLPSLKADNISRSSIWSTAVLQNTRSAPGNRGQRMSLWHLIWLSRDPIEVKGLYGDRGPLEMYDGARHWTKILCRITFRNEFRFSGSSPPLFFFFSLYTVLKVVLIKPSWQMFLEVLVRHEKSSWLIAAM